MTTRCGIRGIKSIEKTQNIENEEYCSKDSDETGNRCNIKKMKPKKR